MASIPDEVTLRPDEPTVLRLPGRSGAGYTWEAHVDDVAVASAVVSFEERTPAPGPGADELLTLSGRRPGTTSVRLLQRRRWEHQRPIADHRLVVTVVARPERREREGG